MVLAALSQVCIHTIRDKFENMTIGYLISIYIIGTCLLLLPSLFLCLHISTYIHYVDYLYWTCKLWSKLSLLVYDDRLLNDSATLLRAFTFFWWNRKGLGSTYVKSELVKTHLPVIFIYEQKVIRQKKTTGKRPYVHKKTSKNTTFKKKRAKEHIRTSQHGKWTSWIHASSYNNYNSSKDSGQYSQNSKIRGSFEWWTNLSTSILHGKFQLIERKT